MSIALREYQLRAVDDWLQYFLSGGVGHPLVILPTGTGKSLVLAAMMKKALEYPNQRVMCATHVKELVEQNTKQMLRYWPSAPVGVHAAGLGQRDLRSQALFAQVQSIVNQAENLPKINILFIDEAHLLSPKENTRYQKLIAILRRKNPSLRVTGLTATAYRQGQGYLTQGENPIFTDIAVNMATPEWFEYFIAHEYMAPLTTRRSKNEVDVSSVSTLGGEFNADELEFAFNKEAITRRVVDELLDTASDRKHWLVFTTGVKHAVRTTEILCEKGISAVCVHSKMHAKERDRNILLFLQRKVRAIVNFGVLTTGFDAPHVDLIVMLRATMSTSLWVQMLGRGTRPCPEAGKLDCLVMDYGGNALRLGPMDDPLVPKQKGKGTGQAPCKFCASCDTMNHTRATVCYVCGAPFPEIVKFGVSAAETSVMAAKPDIRSLRVVGIQYQLRRSKKGSIPMLVVTYSCGLNGSKQITEFVCLEHPDGGKAKARSWWAARTTIPIPATAVKAIALAEQALRVPTHIQVWLNQQYPKILKVDFSGTNFGTEPERDIIEEPWRATVEPPKSFSVLKAITGVPQTEEIAEDDIPF